MMASPDASWPIRPRSNDPDLVDDPDLAMDEDAEEEPRGVRPDSAWGRIRTGWPGAACVKNPTLRRFQGWELLIVLAIFPLGSAVAAIADLIQRVQTQHPLTSQGIPTIDNAWIAAGFAALEYATTLAVPALVFYLLIRSREGVEAINLGGGRLRMDLAFLLPVFIVVQSIPQSIGTHLLSALHIQGFPLPGPSLFFPHGPLTAEQVVVAVTAGVVEEVVVLGFLVRRLEQRAYSATAVVLIAVGVRVSYHLYYGWNVLPILLWAVASVLVYRHIRRLLPFIVCHALWDLEIPFRAFYHGFYQVVIELVFLAFLVMTAMWIRWIPDEDRVHVAALGGASPRLAWSSITPSGWYPDPCQRYQWRYWDGRVWTDHVSTEGTVGSDAFGI
jgi:hypothetical protein